MSSTTPRASGGGGGFRHEAFLYESREEFLARTAAFIREGLSAGEPVLVAVDAEKSAGLRERLPESSHVRWVDVRRIGRNPARITSLWQEFVARAGDGALRGVGEPIWPLRGPQELAESQRHEELLNLAFAGDLAFHLMCPYDVHALDPAVISEARRSHPALVEGATAGPSTDYRGTEAASAPFDEPLPEPSVTPSEDVVDGLSELALFDLARARIVDAGLDGARSPDLALAVLGADESLRRGGGLRRLRVWREDDAVVCELRARHAVHDPLAGRHPPGARPEIRGLWLANQLCDLVELRSFPTGTVARLHMAG
ncbi:MAG: MEDS domain-containing protein [Candidatus Dormibacteraeota bacterium]|nr:MEDS domain-containing protein [Candidatus Dormibacteraeota bacterium]MBO0761277.1 MEDS domain-containing protein [Candidatus Dormibacteraeota bacterium]